MSDLTFSDPPPINPLPQDDFSVPNPTPPHTIYYLTITTPHTDEFRIRGPTRTFSELIPAILTATSISPFATQKLTTHRANPTLQFDTHGFNTFIIPLDEEKNTYTTLQILREINPLVHSNLPCPVYLVTAHGPLTHDMGFSVRRVQSGKPVGMATTSRPVGSFMDGDVAVERARGAMDEMVRGEARVMRSERQEGGGKAGRILMAMNARCVWEVRVAYDEEFRRGV